MKILNIIANPKPEEEAVSKQLNSSFLKGLKENPDNNITTIDLNETPPPYYDYNTYKYFWYPVFIENYKPSPGEEKAVKYSLEQVNLFNEADILVIAAPMWNFSFPAIVKAWIDQVIMPGKTFSMGPDGVKGLHKIKKVFLLTSSGGEYPADDTRNHLNTYLQTVLGFVGITNIEIIWANKQNPFFYPEDVRNKSKEESITRAYEESKKIK